jgi:hypothetical protein
VRGDRSGDTAAVVDLHAAGGLELAIHRADHAQIALYVEAADQPVTRAKDD